jgi:hypothetical protein
MLSKTQAHAEERRGAAGGRLEARPLSVLQRILAQPLRFSVLRHLADSRKDLGYRTEPRRLPGRVTMRSTPAPKGCSKWLALGYKSGVITVVDEDMADETARRAQGDPSASARRGIVVGARP